MAAGFTRAAPSQPRSGPTCACPSISRSCARKAGGPRRAADSTSGGRCENSLMPVPKRVEDLPHFQLRSLSSGRRLQGRFNRTAGVREGRCWLLAPERECLLGDLTSFDPVTGDAVFESADAVPPELPGASLPYVDGYWQAYHVWMVAEPLWQWRRVPM